METINCDKTPKRLLNSEITSRKTPISTPKSFTSRFLLLSSNKSSTPSPSSLNSHLIVRNPFESNHLYDKLHLPVISSPSLFHAPSTPQNNSKKLEVFEWTIEELSNLNPVNVIPHETQFRLEESDPDKEAQVQAAISSFFKEQQIVPSPLIGHSSSISNSTAAIFCVNQKKFLNEKRDVNTQTVLSFPPNLPREIEDLLKQFKYNDDCNANDECENNSENERSMMDISTLRRKLFIHPETPERKFQSMSNEHIVVDLNLSPAPKTPEFNFSRINLETKSSADFKMTCNHTHRVDNENKQTIQRINSDLFGELSPIGRFDSSSTNSSPILSSSVQDISMASDCGIKEQTPTGSRQRSNKMKKKRLSDSFSMLHNEDSLSDKENNFEFHGVVTGACKESMRKTKNNKKIFYRCDSGFREDSTQLMNLSSTEFMQN